jgi:hypothetical protein
MASGRLPRSYVGDVYCLHRWHLDEDEGKSVVVEIVISWWNGDI